MSAAVQVLLQVSFDKAHAMLLLYVRQQRLRRQDAMRYAAWPHLRRQKTGFTKAVGRTTCGRCRPNCRTAGGAQLATPVLLHGWAWVAPAKPPCLMGQGSTLRVVLFL